MRKPLPAIDRTLRRIQVDERGCWNFMGMRNPLGYGRVGVGSMIDGTRGHAFTHRVTYEALVGPIPKGLVIDHLCRNTSCCNPAHLEPVTHTENMRRGETFAAANLAKTHCPFGHEYSGPNLGRDKATGARICRACRAQQQWNLRRARAAAEGRSVRTRRAVAVCGTPGGYKRHRRLGESACDDCLAAWRADGADRQARANARKAAA